MVILRINMKKLILLLLLIALPFQMAMATTSVYCQADDADDTVMAFPSKQFPLSDPAPEPIKQHARCGCCHLDPIGMIAAQLPAHHVLVRDDAYVPQQPVLFSSLHSTPPDRPKWTVSPG